MDISNVFQILKNGTKSCNASHMITDYHSKEYSNNINPEDFC